MKLVCPVGRVLLTGTTYIVHYETGSCQSAGAESFGLVQDLSVKNLKSETTMKSIKGTIEHWCG